MSMTMTSLLWRHLYLEHSQSVQYFSQQFFLQLTSVEQHCELNQKCEQVQQANMFKHQTLMFHFSMASAIHLNIFPMTRRSDCMRDSTAVIVASVVETTLDQIIPLNNTFSTTSELFTPIVFVQYLSPYIGRISDWMTFAVSAFAHRKRVTERCSYGMLSAATLSYLMIINDVTVTSS